MKNGLLSLLVQDGYAVVAADGPGEYPVITESRAGNDGLGVTVTPGTVAYVTTGGFPFLHNIFPQFFICIILLLLCLYLGLMFIQVNNNNKKKRSIAQGFPPGGVCEYRCTQPYSRKRRGYFWDMNLCLDSNLVVVSAAKILPLV